MAIEKGIINRNNEPKNFVLPDLKIDTAKPIKLPDINYDKEAGLFMLKNGNDVYHFAIKLDKEGNKLGSCFSKNGGDWQSSRNKDNLASLPENVREVAKNFVREFDRENPTTQVKLPEAIKPYINTLTKERLSEMLDNSKSKGEIYIKNNAISTFGVRESNK